MSQSSSKITAFPISLSNSTSTTSIGSWIQASKQNSYKIAIIHRLELLALLSEKHFIPKIQRIYMIVTNSFKFKMDDTYNIENKIQNIKATLNSIAERRSPMGTSQSPTPTLNRLLNSGSMDFRCSSPPIRMIDSYKPVTKFDSGKKSLLEERVA